jgi:preprotein translocase SecF subunit
VFDVIGKRNWFFLFSGLILVPGLIFIILTPLTNGKVGLQFSIDYTGGTVWQFQFKDSTATIEEVRTVTEKVLKDAKITDDFTITRDTSGMFTFSTKKADLIAAATVPPTLSPAQASASASASASAKASASASAAAASAQTSAQASAAASAGVSPAPTASPSAAPTASPTLGLAKGNSTDPNGKTCDLVIPETGTLAKLATAFQSDSKLGAITCTGLENTVGALVSSQLIQQAILLILVGSLGILIWIGIRFNSVKFGATALAALLHDVVVVVGFFAVMGTLFGVQIDALFVTAMLTVIGFSVHDTIVVYDRIRENRTRHAGEPFDQIVNHSILQTFGRSINTSLTVVITLFALLLFAGSSIHYFVLALLIGIISGTYSSIFNASPLLVVWQLWEDNRKAERLAAARVRR